MKSWAMNCCSFSTAEVEFLWFDMRWMIGLGPSSIMLSLHVSIWHQVQDTESLVINCKQYMDTGQDDCWRVFMKSMMLPCKTKHVDGQKTRAHCRYWLRDSALDSFDVCVCVSNVLLSFTFQYDHHRFKATFRGGPYQNARSISWDHPLNVKLVAERPPGVVFVGRVFKIPSTIFKGTLKDTSKHVTYILGTSPPLKRW